MAQPRPLCHKPANILINLESYSRLKLTGDDLLEGEVESGIPAWQGIITRQDTLDILTYLESIQ